MTNNTSGTLSLKTIPEYLNVNVLRITRCPRCGTKNNYRRSIGHINYVTEAKEGQIKRYKIANDAGSTWECFSCKLEIFQDGTWSG